MKKTPKLTAQQVADFTAIFANMEPDVKAAPPTTAELVRPYAALIRKQRRRGLSWAQIATGLRTPPLSIKTSDKLLRELFGEPRKRRAASEPSSARLTP